MNITKQATKVRTKQQQKATDSKTKQTYTIHLHSLFMPQFTAEFCSMAEFILQL